MTVGKKKNTKRAFEALRMAFSCWSAATAFSSCVCEPLVVRGELTEHVAMNLVHDGKEEGKREETEKNEEKKKKK